jgi:hypothetical protein
VPRDARRRLVERAWISLFLVSGFLFAVLAPPWAGIPLSLAACGLSVLNAYVYRDLVGAAWMAAAVIFGVLWVSLSVVAAVTGAESGLAVFTL